jgi:hypothetical protein
MRRQYKERKFSNKKGIQLVVTPIGKGKFVKYRKTLQRIGNKTIVHYIEKKTKPNR